MNISFCLIPLYLAFTVQTSLNGAGDSARPETQPVDPQLISECMTILRGGLASDEFWPAMHAAEALTNADSGSEVIAALENRLPNEQDDQRRCGLVRELYRAGDRSHLQVLFEILSNPSSKGRTHAAESLYKIGQTADKTLLRAAMNQSEVIPLQIMAAAALVKAEDHAAMELIRRQLQSPDATARNLSAWVIGRHGNKDDATLVKALLEKETAATVKDEMSITFLAVSLASLGDPQGRSALLNQLSSPNPTARAMAAEFAGLSRTTEAIDTLKAMLRDSALDVRIRSAQSIIVLSKASNP